MSSIIGRYIQNFSVLILGCGIFVLILNIFHGWSKELDHLQEIDFVENDRKF